MIIIMYKFNNFLSFFLPQTNIKIIHYNSIQKLTKMVKSKTIYFIIQPFLKLILLNCSVTVNLFSCRKVEKTYTVHGSKVCCILNNFLPVILSFFFLILH
jgi:hypothetical protein